jgi:multidrug resistance efflux pump
MTVEEAKAALDRAREKQQRWEKLARKGVLSRAEAESCAVEVADALARHERARVAQLTADLTALQERQAKGQASAELVESAKRSLQTAAELSASADQQARQTRITYARTNVERHRKLYSAGLISRIQMQKAEAALRKVEADGREEAIAGK